MTPPESRRYFVDLIFGGSKMARKRRLVSPPAELCQLNVASVRAIESGALPQCVKRADLSGFKSIATTNASAQKYGAAFTITLGPGAFEGSSQSGYSTDVKVKFTRPTSSGYWYWCGDNEVPQDSRKVHSGK